MFELELPGFVLAPTEENKGFVPYGSKLARGCCCCCCCCCCWPWPNAKELDCWLLLPKRPPEVVPAGLLPNSPPEVADVEDWLLLPKSPPVVAGLFPKSPPDVDDWLLLPKRPPEVVPAGLFPNKLLVLLFVVPKLGVVVVVAGLLPNKDPDAAFVEPNPVPLEAGLLPNRVPDDALLLLFAPNPKPPPLPVLAVLLFPKRPPPELAAGLLPKTLFPNNDPFCALLVEPNPKPVPAGLLGWPKRPPDWPLLLPNSPPDCWLLLLLPNRLLEVLPVEPKPPDVFPDEPNPPKVGLLAVVFAPKRLPVLVPVLPKALVWLLLLPNTPLPVWLFEPKAGVVLYAPNVADGCCWPKGELFVCPNGAADEPNAELLFEPKADVLLLDDPKRPPVAGLLAPKRFPPVLLLDCPNRPPEVVLLDWPKRPPVLVAVPNPPAVLEPKLVPVPKLPVPADPELLPKRLPSIGLNGTTDVPLFWVLVAPRVDPNRGAVDCWPNGDVVAVDPKAEPVLFDVPKRPFDMVPVEAVLPKADWPNGEDELLNDDPVPNKPVFEEVPLAGALVLVLDPNVPSPEDVFAVAPNKPPVFVFVFEPNGDEVLLFTVFVPNGEELLLFQVLLEPNPPNPLVVDAELPNIINQGTCISNGIQQG
ncbi:hypothetical protein OGATHE_002435 [Ogataea polymorpha]|uniref:Uncharacterized protein n=1 Tax=Ogataea polymorpha TaxID=460523 RepID=A0A9P8PC97_9ASCO|nr:hypothetical protein OGATHE_002435 [Ogataea polymorpha]